MNAIKRLIFRLDIYFKRLIFRFDMYFQDDFVLKFGSIGQNSMSVYSSHEIGTKVVWSQANSNNGMIFAYTYSRGKHNNNYKKFKLRVQRTRYLWECRSMDRIRQCVYV